VSFDHALTLGRVVWRAPNAHCLIPAAADNCRAVECYTEHETRVSIEFVRALARLHVPHAHCIIPTARDESVLLNDPMTHASFMKVAL
jgi:hypothetical protein